MQESDKEINGPRAKPRLRHLKESSSCRQEITKVEIRLFGTKKNYKKIATEKLKGLGYIGRIWIN